MQYVFRPRNAQPVDPHTVLDLASALNLEPLIAHVLCVRGYSDPHKAAAFLQSDPQTVLHDPFLFPDMDIALARIHLALERGERIAVYGDYDADGVCACAILHHALRCKGARVITHLPSRRGEGYGLHNSAVDALQALGVDLIITVDCGITSVEECAYAMQLGIDMIVTDHHQPLDVLPPAIAVVAATRKDSVYPFDGLCGAGVAFKVAQALLGNHHWNVLVQLAAVATVADIVPLLDENRFLVREGLRHMRTRPLLGIAKICALARIDWANLSAYNIAFGIAPRLNAAGRMGDAARAVALLEEQGNLDDLAAQLESENAQRQVQETAFLQQALDMIEAEQKSDRRCVVLQHSAWDHGIIGIVASRLQERLNVPVWLFCEHGDKLRGSGRSIDGIDMFQVLQSFVPLFDKFGGHKMAAGITMPKKSFAPFKEGLEHIFAELPIALFTPTASYDVDADPRDITLAVCRQLEALEPFGCSNPAPAFRVSDVTATGIRSIGKAREHLRFNLDGGLECVAFHQAGRLPFLPYAKSLEILLVAQINRFGREHPQGVVRRVNLQCMRDAAAFMLSKADEFADAIAAKIIYNEIPFAFVPAKAAVIPLEAAVRAVCEEGRGTVLCAYTPAGGVAAIEELERAGVLARVEVTVSASTSGAALLPQLLLAPLDGAFAGYTQAACADGRAAEWLTRSSIQAMELSRDQMLAYHRALKGVLSRRNVFEDERQLAQLLSTAPEVRRGECLAHVALCVFLEMGLLDMQSQENGKKFALIVLPERVDLADSPTYRAFGRAVQDAHNAT